MTSDEQRGDGVQKHEGSIDHFHFSPCRNNRFVNRNRERVSKARQPIMPRDRSATRELAADGSGTEIVKKGSDSVGSLSWREKQRRIEGTMSRVPAQAGANAGSALAVRTMTRIEKKPHRYTTRVAQRALVVAPAVTGSLSCIAMMSAVESGPVSSGLVPNESSLSHGTQRCGSRTRTPNSSGSALRAEAASRWLADSAWLASSDRKWMPIRGKRRSAMSRILRARLVDLSRLLPRWRSGINQPLLTAAVMTDAAAAESYESPKI